MESHTWDSPAAQPCPEPEDVEFGLVALFCVKYGEEEEEMPSYSIYENSSGGIIYPLFHDLIPQSSFYSTVQLFSFFPIFIFIFLK